MKNPTIILQRLKPLNCWMIALIVGGIAIAGGSLYYSLSQFGQKPAEPIASVPVNQPITGLGRLEPASEVVRVAAPTTLNNDRIAQLLVKRGDRVQEGHIIAILESHERLQTALLEARERVSTAQAQLAEVKSNRNRTADTLRAQTNQARATLNQIAEVRPEDVQVAQTEVNQAIAAVKRAEAELKEATIRAPLAGQVLDVYTKPGEAIADEGTVGEFPWRI